MAWSALTIGALLLLPSVAAVSTPAIPLLTQAPWGAWVTQFADMGPNLGVFDSIDINSHDLPVIANSAGAGVQIDTATAGAVWSSIVLHDRTLQPSLKVDNNDHAHVCMQYVDNTDQELEHLWYATDESGSWVISAVDTNPRVGFFCSLQLDNAGYSHIAYTEVITGSWDKILHYAYQDSTGWHLETIGRITHAGVDTSLALDPAGNAHISLEDFSTDASNGSIRYYSRSATGTWTSETAVPHGGAGALAIGASGTPQIAYYAPGFTLGYAVKSVGSWITTIVDSASVTGQYPKLALDSHERPHIAYAQGAGAPVSDHPRYASRDASGNWQLEYVYLDSVDTLGPNIAIDHNDRPHVIFTQARDQTGHIGDAMLYSVPAAALADSKIVTG